MVQASRITERYQTRLDKLLSVFEQRHFTDSRAITKEFFHKVDTEELETLVGILHHAGVSPSERIAIEREEEAWRTYRAMFGAQEREYEERIAEQAQAPEEKDKALEEKDKALAEQERLIAELKKKLGEDS